MEVKGSELDIKVVLRVLKSGIFLEERVLID